MQIEVFIELVRAVVPIIFILVILGGVLQIFRRKSMGSSNENFELEIGEEFSRNATCIQGASGANFFYHEIITIENHTL